MCQLNLNKAEKKKKDRFGIKSLFKSWLSFLNAVGLSQCSSLSLQWCLCQLNEMLTVKELVLPNPCLCFPAPHRVPFSHLQAVVCGMPVIPCLPNICCSSAFFHAWALQSSFMWSLFSATEPPPHPFLPYHYCLYGFLFFALCGVITNMLPY